VVFQNHRLSCHLTPKGLRKVQILFLGSGNAEGVNLYEVITESGEIVYTVVRNHHALEVCDEIPVQFYPFHD